VCKSSPRGIEPRFPAWEAGNF